MSSKSLYSFAINTVNWVCLQRNVCLYLPRNNRDFFSRCGVLQQFQCTHISLACHLHKTWPHFVFMERIGDTTRANSFARWVHSAGSFISCHLTPPPPPALFPLVTVLSSIPPCQNQLLLKTCGFIIHTSCCNTKGQEKNGKKTT